MNKVYGSRVDWWLAVALVLPVIGGGAAIVQGLIDGTYVVWIGVAALGFYAFILGGLVLPMRYTIGGDGLHVRAGLLLRVTIPWDRLVGAAFSRNPLSSPALSLRRICIDYKKPSGKQTWVLISPTDREAFLRDVAAASGRHRVDGERLVAVDPG